MGKHKYWEFISKTFTFVSVIIMAIMVCTLAGTGSIKALANNNSGPSGTNSYIMIDKGSSNQVLIYKGSDPDLGVYTYSSIAGITYDIESNTITLKNFNHPTWTLETDEMGVDLKIRVLGTCALKCIYIQGGTKNWGAGLYLTGSGTLTVNASKVASNGINIDAEYTYAMFGMGAGVTLNTYGTSTSKYDNDNKPIKVNNTLCANAIVLPDSSLKMRSSSGTKSMPETKDFIELNDARVKLTCLTNLTGTDVTGVYAYPTSYVDGVQLYTIYEVISDSVLGKCAKPVDGLINISPVEKGYEIKYDVYDNKVYTSDTYVRLDYKKNTSFNVYTNNSTGATTYIRELDNVYYLAAPVESSYGTYAEVATISDISSYTEVAETYKYYTYVTQDIVISIYHEHTIVNVAAVPATCTSTGTKAGTLCSECGEIVSGFETIPMLAHDHSVETITKKASPTQRGTIEAKCSMCGGDTQVSEIYKPSRVSLSETTVNADASGAYTKPTVTIYDEGGNLVDPSNYSVSYTDKSTTLGTATITFDSSRYTGSSSKNYLIAGIEVKPEITLTAGDGTIDVKWTALPGATNYRVFTYLNKTYTKIADTSKTTYTIKGLSNGTKYGVLVKAYINGSWRVSDTAHIKYATPVDPNAHFKPVISSITAGDGKITVKWGAISGATNYRVFTYLNSKYTKIGDTKATTYTITGLTNGTKYGVLVKAYVNGAWVVSDTDHIKYETPVDNTKPVISSITAKDGKITVTWGAISGATNYRVFTYLNSKYTKIGDTKATTYTITGLTNGTKYGVLVKACINGTWVVSDTAHIKYATPTAQNS